MTFRNELHYITPIENIASIMERGLLSNELATLLNHRSVAMNEVQRRRDRVRVPNGLRLHQYVNLYFDARNPMMYKIKEQVEDLCVLLIEPVVLELDQVVIADRNASADYVRFIPSLEGIRSLDFDMVYCEDWRDGNQHAYFRKKSIKCAEVLVPNRISQEFISGAYVASTAAKARLESQGFSLTITLNPRMFFLE